MCENFTKILRLGSIRAYPKSELFMPVFVKVEFRDGKLSMTGVEGPKHNGDAIGSCGQIEIQPGNKSWKFADGWDRDKVHSLKTIWERWHLNDRNPNCEHQRKLGWTVKAMQEVKLYHWSLSTAKFQEQRQIKERAMAKLKDHGSAGISRLDQTTLRLPLSRTTHSDIAPEHYKPDSRKPTDTRTLGWLNPEEHPEGILTKPCPECGYKYGTAWRKETVPDTVLDFLKSLPDTDKQPAWI